MTIKLEEITITTDSGIKNLAQISDEEFEGYIKDIGFEVKDSIGGWSYTARQMMINHIKGLVEEAMEDEGI